MAKIKFCQETPESVMIWIERVTETQGVSENAL